MTMSSNAVTAATSREAVPPSAGAPKSAGLHEQAQPTTLVKVSPATPEQDRVALEEINHTLQMAAIGVQFEFDKEADTMIVKVVDVESGELIRQMPSEEAVRISKALGKLQGLLVHQAV